MWKPGDLFPADDVAGEMHKDVHLCEQRTIAQLQRLQIIILRQDGTYLQTDRQTQS